MHNKNEASKMREDNPNQLESNRKSALLARYNRLKLIYSSHRVKTEILFKEAYRSFFNSKHGHVWRIFSKTDKQRRVRGYGLSKTQIDS